MKKCTLFSLLLFIILGIPLSLCLPSGPQTEDQAIDDIQNEINFEEEISEMSDKSAELQNVTTIDNGYDVAVQNKDSKQFFENLTKYAPAEDYNFSTDLSENNIFEISINKNSFGSQYTKISAKVTKKNHSSADFEHPFQIRIINKKQYATLYLPNNDGKNQILISIKKNKKEANELTMLVKMEKIELPIITLLKSFRKREIEEANQTNPFPLYSIRVDNVYYQPSLNQMWKLGFQAKKGIKLKNTVINKSMIPGFTKGKNRLITSDDKNTHPILKAEISSPLCSQKMPIAIYNRYRYNGTNSIKKNVKTGIKLDAKNRVLIGFQLKKVRWVWFDIPYILHYFTKQKEPDSNHTSNSLWVNINEQQYAIDGFLFDNYVHFLQLSQKGSQEHVVLYEKNKHKPLVQFGFLNKSTKKESKEKLVIEKVTTIKEKKTSKEAVIEKQSTVKKIEQPNQNVIVEQTYFEKHTHETLPKPIKKNNQSHSLGVTTQKRILAQNDPPQQIMSKIDKKKVIQKKINELPTDMQVDIEVIKYLKQAGINDQYIQGNFIDPLKNKYDKFTKKSKKLDKKRSNSSPPPPNQNKMSSSMVNASAPLAAIDEDKIVDAAPATFAYNPAISVEPNLEDRHQGYPNLKLNPVPNLDSNVVATQGRSYQDPYAEEDSEKEIDIEESSQSKSSQIQIGQVKSGSLTSQEEESTAEESLKEESSQSDEDQVKILNKIGVNGSHSDQKSLLQEEFNQAELLDGEALNQASNFELNNVKKADQKVSSSQLFAKDGIDEGIEIDKNIEHVFSLEEASEEVEPYQEERDPLETSEEKVTNRSSVLNDQDMISYKEGEDRESHNVSGALVGLSVLGAVGGALGYSYSKYTQKGKGNNEISSDIPDGIKD
ncbi:MAG: hypothetical protein AAF770_03330 [Bacteroidota bacterium]